jgi:U2-associated protein SR140
VTNPRAKKAQTHKQTTVFEGGPNWAPPKSDLKYEYTTRLDEFVSDEDYNSSDEEHSDGEDERRNLSGAPPDGTNAQGDGHGYMNPMRKAKLTHLLARLPTSHARLRRGDVARVTAFAIEHAGAGADEVVDMIVLNILHPLAYTGANPDRESEKTSARSETAEKENFFTTKETLDVSASKLVGLYIISDILSSSATSGVRHAWRYRQLFESALRSHKVFEHLGRLDKDLHWGRMKAEKWKRSIGTLLHLWEGWCVFAQSSQEHFVQVFEKPPLTEVELQKEQEKAQAERAAAAFAKGKSRWKTVDDDESAGKFDPTRPALEESQSTAGPAEYELMSDIDGVPMEDSDLEELDDDQTTKEPPPVSGGTQEQPHQPPSKAPQTSVQPDQPAAKQETEGRQRKPRPKAEDMFASDSE